MEDGSIPKIKERLPREKKGEEVCGEKATVATATSSRVRKVAALKKKRGIAAQRDNPGSLSGYYEYKTRYYGTRHTNAMHI